DGRIEMLCAEDLAPYDRPPLSKQVLRDEQAKLAFRPAGWYADNAVELHLGQEAVSLDPDSLTVRTAAGGRFRAERVLVATGSVHGRARVEAIELASGRRIDCDAVVIGVGVEPATRWLDSGWADHPGIFAAGDATGGQHWEAAARGGVAAAHAMLGLTPPA